MTSTSTKRKLFGAASKSGRDKSTGFEGSDDDYDHANRFDVETPTKKVKTDPGKTNGVNVKVKKEKQTDKLRDAEIKNEAHANVTGDVTGDADADGVEYENVNEIA